MSDSIQLFVPTFRVEECLAEIRECFEKGWTGLGFKTVQFENAWKAYTGHRNAHFLASATAGLHLAVHVMKERYGWRDGDEVISTPITFVSTNHSILYERLNAIFADVDEYGCLDPDSVEQRVTSRTRAVIFVGLGGNTGRLPQIIEFCRAKGLKLILDAAHMAGARLNGSTPDKGIDAVVYSFHAVKNLPTADSGMVCFADQELDALVRQQSWLGIDKDTFTRTLSGGAYKWHYDVPRVGFKSHGNSIMAGIGLVQLKYLDQDNAYRRQLSAWYDEFLGGTNVIRRVPTAPGCESSRHLYQVCVPHRDEVFLALNNAGIFPGVHYRTNTDYAMYRHMADDCPNAGAFSKEVISLPLHLRLQRADVERVSRQLIDIVSDQNP